MQRTTPDPEPWQGHDAAQEHVERWIDNPTSGPTLWAMAGRAGLVIAIILALVAVTI